MENPKKVLTKPIEEYDAMCEALTGLAGGDRKKYVQVMSKFCKFVGKDPDTIIQERREHERSGGERIKRTYERKIIEFYYYLRTTPVKGRKPMHKSSAFTNIVVVWGFFDHNYCKMFQTPLL